MGSKLAIVIPYYKIDFFEKTIQSLAVQTSKNFTLYIGNDASPDDPLPVILKYFEEEEFKYYPYKDNLGGKNLALQWERILENVSEEWFQILGDDDMISENFVEAFYTVLKSSKYIKTVKFLHSWIGETGKTIESFDYQDTKINSVDFFIRKYRNLVKSSLSENIFRTDIYRRKKFDKIPLAWGSDDLALLAFSDFSEIIYNRNASVKVRISESSISGSEKLENERKKAFSFFQKTMLTKYSYALPFDFLHEVLQHYLDFCHIEKNKASYICALFYLKKLKIVPFLKAIKKIYYINQLAVLNKRF